MYAQSVNLNVAAAALEFDVALEASWLPWFRPFPTLAVPAVNEFK